MSASNDILTLGAMPRHASPSRERALVAHAPARYVRADAGRQAVAAVRGRNIRLVGEYGAEADGCRRAAHERQSARGARFRDVSDARPARGTRFRDVAEGQPAHGARFTRVPAGFARDESSPHVRQADVAASRPRPGRRGEPVPGELHVRESARSRRGEPASDARGTAPSVAGRVAQGVGSLQLPSPSAVLGWAAAHRAIVVAAASVLFVLAMLYPPARTYYTALRGRDAVSAQLSTLSSSNDALQGEVGALMTREGIEDEARRRGFVAEGDTAVDMSGVDDTGTSAATDATVLSGSDASADASQPWYAGVLDFVFQYDSKGQGVS